MARRFDLIVFDWDGTLLDSAAAIVRSIQSAASDLGFAPPSDAAARQVIGLGLVDALSRAMPDLEPAQYPRMAERYRHHYLSADHELQLFAGAVEMLEALHGQGYWLGVATGKSRMGLDRALKISGIGGLFHATRCADECFSKPHPAMLLEIMDHTGVEADRTLMVGDTVHDLQMARNAAVAALGVAFGAHPREQLEAESPLEVVADMAELRAWIDRHG